MTAGRPRTGRRSSTSAPASPKFDGGLPREEAEARAFDHCVVEWLNRNPVRSPPVAVSGCGRGGEHAGVVLPFGTEDQRPRLAAFGLLASMARRPEGRGGCRTVRRWASAVPTNRKTMT